MGLIYNIDKRSAIPRWRNPVIALGAGEVSPVGISPIMSPYIYSRKAISEQIFSWNKYKTVGHAADLLSAAYTLGIENEFIDVAEFLYHHRGNISPILSKLVDYILNDDKSFSSSLEVNVGFYTEEGQSKIIKELGTIRNYLKQEPKNPLGWIELARNHAMLGNVEKSKKAVANALSVNDTSDRFVLRSASRFFHHLGDDERAHSIIKKSRNLKIDPWLISSEIAFSTILDRKSTLIKTGKEFLKSQKFSPFQLSELASSIGTVEFRQGDVKSAKAMFKAALLSPNDNSLAQVLWFQKKIPFIDISAKLLEMPLAFEAQTQAFYNNSRYEEACKSALRWLNDEPYSTRPVRLASYISTIFLENTKTSIEILKHGIKVNPKDLKLLNSLSYNLLLENKIEEAEKLFKRYDSKSIRDASLETKIALVATDGLYHFRKNNIETGREYYMHSIDFAAKQKNDYLHALAIANYVREEIIICNDKNVHADKLRINSLIGKLIDLTKDMKYADVLKLKEKALAEFAKTT